MEIEELLDEIDNCCYESDMQPDYLRRVRNLIGEILDILEN